MILSHEHQFLFIKTKKTGSSSLELYLQKFLNEKDRNVKNSNTEKNKNEGMYNHIGGFEFITNIKNGKELWKDYLTFTIVRHPMERIISEFYWSDQNGKYNNDFDAYLKDQGKLIGTRNYPLIVSAPFDFIIYYENYINDINTVLSILNFPKVDQSSFPKDKTNIRKDRSPWYEFMNAHHIKTIMKTVPEEIEIHQRLGYKIGANLNG